MALEGSRNSGPQDEGAGQPSASRGDEVRPALHERALSSDERTEKKSHKRIWITLATVALLGVALNALVALATTGFMVFVSHHQLLGFTRQPLDSSITPLIFVLLFGLSMDYEVILLHRIQEYWHGNRSLNDAVEHGVATTGSMITGAGMIMVVVFLALLISPLQIMKTFGIGLSFAVLADTWIVRSLLVPSVTTIFKGASFWPGRRVGQHSLPSSLP